VNDEALVHGEGHAPGLRPVMNTVDVVLDAGMAVTFQVDHELQVISISTGFDVKLAE
jgi:hypothetical protein